MAPQKPGVYIIKNSFKEILYVGKAKNLKNRMSSYFKQGLSKNRQENRLHVNFRSSSISIKTQHLIQKMEDIDWILTSDEVEAFLLEATLIKKHKPKYNIRLKDDKAYPYLRCILRKDFPRFDISRKIKNDGAFYFGPYTQTRALKEVMDFINKTFKIRDCSDTFMKNRTRPCLTHQIGFCDAPCMKWISKEDYQKKIKVALSFLQGKNRSLQKTLQSQMKEAALKENFELATRLRNQLQSLDVISKKNQKVSFDKNLDQDVIAFKGEQNLGVLIELLHIRSASVIGKSTHFVSSPRLVEFYPSEWVTSFLSQYYSENYIPSRILFHQDFERKHILLLEKILKKKQKKPLSLISFSKNLNKENQELLNQVFLSTQTTFKDFKKKQKKQWDALKEIQLAFQLPKIPRRMECYDISHFQGSNPVGSQVVFEDGKPKKSDYRHYKIKTSSYNSKSKTKIKIKIKSSLRLKFKKSSLSFKPFQHDDYASLKEVLKRRLKHSEFELPQLMVIDGGRGQLNKVLEALKEEGFEDQFLVVGMAKARVEKDFEKAFVTGSEERFYLPYKKEAFSFPKGSKALDILVALRDEAHRFALRLQKKQRKLDIGT